MSQFQNPVSPSITDFNALSTQISDKIKKDSATYTLTSSAGGSGSFEVTFENNVSADNVISCRCSNSHISNCSGLQITNVLNYNYNKAVFMYYSPKAFTNEVITVERFYFT
jgi:hypothetical protein